MIPSDCLHVDEINDAIRDGQFDQAVVERAQELGLTRPADNRAEVEAAAEEGVAL